MKNFSKTIVTVLTAVFVLSFFSSCNNDDVQIRTDIVGIWKSEDVSATGEADTQDGATVLVFGDDMKVTAGQTTGNHYEWFDNAEYAVNGSEMVISYTDHENVNHAIKCIVHVEGDKMYLSHFTNKEFSDMTLIKQ